MGQENCHLSNAVRMRPVTLQSSIAVNSGKHGRLVALDVAVMTEQRV